MLTSSREGAIEVCRNVFSLPPTRWLVLLRICCCWRAVARRRRRRAASAYHRGAARGPAPSTAGFGQSRHEARRRRLGCLAFLDNDHRPCAAQRHADFSKACEASEKSSRHPKSRLTRPAEAIGGDSRANDQRFAAAGTVRHSCRISFDDI